MKKILLLLPLLALCIAAKAQYLVDTHNDVLSIVLMTGADVGKLQKVGNFDLIRAKQGGLDAQVFSIWCGDDYGKGTAYARANREIDSLDALIKRNPTKMMKVSTPVQFKQAIASHKLAAMVGVEGGHMIEDRMDYLDALAKRGMRYLTLTWNNSTSWASSARDETLHRDSLKHIGLTEYGKQIVRHMNDIGVMVDVSHVGEQTFYDVMATTSKPVIASHSCVYALDHNRRNLKDAQLKALAKNGGVVFVNFYSGFVDSAYDAKATRFLHQHRTELDSLIKIYHDNDLSIQRLNQIHQAESDQIRPPFDMLIRHIDYIVKLIGVDHVGIGADFDGAESYPLGLNSVADYPKVFAALKKIGYSQTDINKIKGSNFMRVFEANVGK